MHIGRKLATIAVTTGVALGAVVVTAPAHAIDRVGCPTNGLTVSTNANGNFCAAGSIGYKTISTLTGGSQGDVRGVVRESTNWNWAAFYNSTGAIQLKPGEHRDLPTVIVYALEIDNPGWT
ncbi:hypothetical protein [Streptomyces sp. NPDC057910]|uniref:hypothetical protein n=1 Tax=Streptomyces sp. NPDC057910 TaxID=3346278 RepID=UPI0036E6C392